MILCICKFPELVWVGTDIRWLSHDLERNRGQLCNMWKRIVMLSSRTASAIRPIIVITWCGLWKQTTSSCCRRYSTGAQHGMGQFIPFIHPATWLSPCVTPRPTSGACHEFTPSYLDCPAGVDLLMMKTVPLLAVLVLQRQRTNCVLFLLYAGRKRADGRSLITFRMLLWCFCSLSRSVGRATLTNLWTGASRRLSVSLLLSSAMCPADCPQQTPLWKFEAAPAQFYLTAPTITTTIKVGFWYESMQ